MDDDRNRGVARDPQLFAEKELLPGHVGARFDRVDADLPHSDEARVGARRKYRGAQARQIIVSGALEPERMQPERVGETVALGKRAHLRLLVDVSGRHHQHRDARSTRARHDVLAVRIELIRVQVAVRVDPH